MKVGDRVRVRDSFDDGRALPGAKGRVGTILRVESCKDDELGVTIRLDEPMCPGDSPDWVMCPSELELL